MPMQFGVPQQPFGPDNDTIVYFDKAMVDAVGGPSELSKIYLEVNGASPTSTERSPDGILWIKTCYPDHANALCEEVADRIRRTAG